MKIRNSLAWLLALSSAACGGSPTSSTDDMQATAPHAGDAGDAGAIEAPDSGTSPETATVGAEPTPDAGAPIDEDASPSEDASPGEDAGNVDAQPTSEDGGDAGLTMWCVAYIVSPVAKPVSCCGIRADGQMGDCPGAFPIYTATNVPSSENNVGKPCVATTVGATNGQGGPEFTLTCNGAESITGYYPVP